MATLVNKMNREVKVIIPNMREFRVFYSDNEGSVMFFKRDWIEEKQEGHWKPSEEQIAELKALANGKAVFTKDFIVKLYNDLLKLK